MLVSTENLQSVLEEIRLAKIISTDAETFGLNSFKGDCLFSIIISTEKDDYYFNFKDYPEENISPLPRSVIDDLKPIFLDETKIHFLQNAKFDMHMLAREGIFFAGKIYDTAVLDRIHFNQHMSYNLAEITKRWGDEKLDIVWKYIEENKLKTKTHHERFNKTVEQPHFDRVPFSIIQPYGEQDGAGTLNVGKQILAKIQQDDQTLDPRIPKQMQVVENEARLTKTLFHMEHRGIQLDLDYCNEALDHYLRILQKSEIAFKNLTGLDFVKGTTVFEEVFASEKDKWEKTEKGNWKWDADVLETFENPSAKLAIEWAEAKKQSEYFANFLYYCDRNGVLHPTFNQAGTVTGRLSSKDPNCLSMDTEILTKTGWKGPDTISFDDEIANFDKELGVIGWFKPHAIFKSEFKKREMIEFTNQHIKWRVTSDHRVVSIDRKSGKLFVNKAIDLPKDCHILHSSITCAQEYPITDELLKLCVAIQADGHFVSQVVRFIFKKKRKVERLENILKVLNIAFSSRTKHWSNAIHYEIKFNRCHLPLLTKNKIFSSEVLKLSFRQLVLFLEELKHWDGLSTRDNFDYCSTKKENIDIIQGAAALCGYRAHVYKHASTKSEAFVVSFTRRDYSGTANLDRKIEEVEERVWCVSVPTGFIVSRRKGDTFITGNCQNLTNPDKYEEQTEAALYPVRRSFIPRPGYFFAMLDFQQVEFRLALDYANANSLIREVINGHDVHTATAQLAGISRKEAKTVNFLCIAEDQLVLTNQGLIPIQNVTTSHKVWDGVEWVSHDGVIFKGEAGCIDYEGLIATEDHEVFTEKGWKVSIRDLTRKQNLGRIVVTESKGSPIRFSKTIRKYSKKNWEPQMEKETSWVFSMLCLLKNQMDKLGEYIQRLCQNMQMYEYQAEGVCELRSESSKEAPRKILSGSNQVFFSKLKSLSQLWGKGYSSEMLFKRMERVFLKELFRGSNNEARHRPNRQRRTLRNRELATCDEIREFKKSTKKVYDILNAGPRNRFTVSGKLVSNCIYGGGVVKLAQNLYETKGAKAQLGAIYKKMFGWRLSDEEQRAWPTVTDELRQFNEPVIRKAYDVQQSVFRAAPEIKDFLKAVQRAAETRGYVRNYLGRRYYFTDKRWSYKAPNHLIQGSAADIIKTAMNKVDEYLKDKKSKMLLSIHDELVVEVRYGEEFVVDEIKKIMQGIWVNRRLPLLVDVEWSEKNLADKQDWSSENFSRVTETRNNIQSKVEIST